MCANSQEIPGCATSSPHRPEAACAGAAWHEKELQPSWPPRTAAVTHPFRPRSPGRHPVPAVPRQPNCTDRFASPIQNPSITDFCASSSPDTSAAPMVTNSGAKCSVRGWA